MQSNIEKKKKKRRSVMPRGGYGVLLLVMGLVAVAFMAMLVILEVIPANITAVLVGLMLAIIIVTRFLMTRDGKKVRIAGLIVAVLFVGVYGVGTYYLGSTYAAFEKMSTERTDGTQGSRDVTTEAFNLYITGIDQWESEKGRDLERSDVNMIVTVNPITRKVLLTSIPRDTYIILHTAQQGDKLTHTGVYGVEETLNTVEDWLGFDMNYYVKMNFTAVVDVINAIGGIEVYSPKSFVPTKRSWWTVKKGWNHMNGKEALAFARERKAFDGEDSARVENQQRVVDAILRKMMTSPKLLTKYPDILAAASNNMSTDMSSTDMQKLVRMQLEDLGEWDIESQKVKGDYEMDYVASLTQDQQFLVYKAYPASVDKVKHMIDNVMNPTEEEIREAEEIRKRKFFSGIFSKFTGGDDEESDGE